MAKQTKIAIELTLHEAVTLWGYLDVRPNAETLRWVRDRIARAFAEAVDTNIETEAKRTTGDK